MDPELSKKLRSLGVHLGTKHVKPKREIDHPGESPFQRAFQFENIFGTSIFTERKYDAGYFHGSNSLIDATQIEKNWNIGEFENIALRKCVFIDTETTGLSQSAGTFAFMVGLGYWKQENFMVRQYFLRHPGEEAAMLLHLINTIEEFKYLVSYNGIGFDVPILISRLKLYRLPSDLNRKTHIDLLKFARRLWRFQFDNRSLKSIEEKVLHFTRSNEEIPGWMVPDMYREFIKTGNAAQMKGVFYHNEIDIVSLTALFQTIDAIYMDHQTFSEEFNTIGFALARSFEREQNHVKAIEIYTDVLNQSNLPARIRVEGLLRLAALHKRIGNLTISIDLWKRAIDFHSCDACIELAKALEHNLKDLNLALKMTDKAFVYIEEETNPVKKNRIVEELAYRKKRLEKKLSKDGRE